MDFLCWVKGRKLTGSFSGTASGDSFTLEKVSCGSTSAVLR